MLIMCRRRNERCTGAAYCSLHASFSGALLLCSSTLSSNTAKPTRAKSCHLPATSPRRHGLVLRPWKVLGKLRTQYAHNYVQHDTFSSRKLSLVLSCFVWSFGCDCIYWVLQNLHSKRQYKTSRCERDFISWKTSHLPFYKSSLRDSQKPVILVPSCCQILEEPTGAVLSSLTLHPMVAWCSVLRRKLCNSFVPSKWGALLRKAPVWGHESN